MRARAVIGANFGDEGKGLVVDWLCRTGGTGVVVRYNGGAQAGHTVVSELGRHICQHVGAGTLAGVPTFLSEFFVCNPIAFFRELKTLEALGITPLVYVDPKCLITTFADMMINQILEEARGDDRHGSCGLGFNETIERSKALPHLKITMADLWNGINLESILEEICGKYAEFRTGGQKIEVANGIETFIKACEAFANYVRPAGIGQIKDPIFEGAQGLLLDQDNKEFYPHVTRSSTGMKNVRHLCDKAGITEIEPYYVSRTYLTRHGAGSLPGEDASMCFHDNTNLMNPHQGRLRFAPLDYGVMLDRCWADVGKYYKIVLTHCDQKEPENYADLYSYGPAANDIEADRKRLSSVGGIS